MADKKHYFESSESSSDSNDDDVPYKKRKRSKKRQQVMRYQTVPAATFIIQASACTQQDIEDYFGRIEFDVPQPKSVDYAITETGVQTILDALVIYLNQKGANLGVDNGAELMKCVEKDRTWDQTKAVTGVMKDFLNKAKFVMDSPEDITRSYHRMLSVLRSTIGKHAHMRSVLEWVSRLCETACGRLKNIDVHCALREFWSSLLHEAMYYAPEDPQERTYAVRTKGLTFSFKKSGKQWVQARPNTETRMCTRSSDSCVGMTDDNGLQEVIHDITVTCKPDLVCTVNTMPDSKSGSIRPLAFPLVIEVKAIPGEGLGKEVDPWLMTDSNTQLETEDSEAVYTRKCQAKNDLGESSDSCTSPPPGFKVGTKKHGRHTPMAKSVPIPNTSGSGESSASGPNLPRIKNRNEKGADNLHGSVYSRLNQMKTQHFLELLSTIRRDNGTNLAEQATRQNKAFGLYIVMNKVYVTLLTLNDDSLQHSAERLIENALFEELEDLNKVVWFKMSSTKWWLNSFNPVHFEALMYFIRYIFFKGERPIDFNVLGKQGKGGKGGKCKGGKRK